MKRIVAALMIALLAVSIAACKTPPKRTAKPERSDTGMHEGPM